MPNSGPRSIRGGRGSQGIEDGPRPHHSNGWGGEESLLIKRDLTLKEQRARRLVPVPGPAA